MEPGRDALDAVREPWVARHGLLAAVVLAGAALLAPLLGPAGDDAVAAPDPAPYGVAGCSPADGAAPVDVAVTARALDADGAPAAALGARADGPEVGASVRNLAGYAAEDIAPCEVVQVAVHLHDGAGSVPGDLQRADPLTVAGEGGAGRLVALDRATWAASLPAGLPAGDPAEPAAWFVTLVDPVPGTYRWQGRLTAQTPAADSGPVEVVVEITPTAGA